MPRDQHAAASMMIGASGYLVRHMPTKECGAYSMDIPPSTLPRVRR